MEGAGRWDVASQYWERLLERLPGVPDGRTGLRLAHMRRCGHHQLAVEHFSTAVNGYERIAQADDPQPEGQTAE